MTVAPRRRSKIRGAVSGKFGILLIALIALLAFAPLMVERPVWNAFLGLSTYAVLIASLHAARPGGKPVIFGLILGVGDFVIGRVATFDGTRTLVALQSGLWLVILVFVTITLLETIFESERVSVETLQASLCVYVLLGLVWVFFYNLIEIASPGSFQSQNGFRFDWAVDRSRRAEFSRLLVFSFSTLSTTGFGDLSPRTGFVSIAASLEAMTGQIYLAVVIARLVGIQSAPTASHDRDRAVE